MKKLVIVALVMAAFSLPSNAQFVRVQIGFPAGYTVRPARPPHPHAIWVGPEWRWQRGQYVAVPGYWAKPHRHKNKWKSGYWSQGRRGYRWVPGYWR